MRDPSITNTIWLIIRGAFLIIVIFVGSFLWLLSLVGFTHGGPGVVTSFLQIVISLCWLVLFTHGIRTASVEFDLVEFFAGEYRTSKLDRLLIGLTFAGWVLGFAHVIVVSV